MEMIKFARPEALYLLFLLIPVAVGYIWFIRGRRKALNAMGTRHLVTQLLEHPPKHKHPIKFVLVLLALACFVVALANPQLGTKYEKVKRSGVDLIVALDISRSMLAEDVRPNRLRRAKLFINRLIEQLSGDRIGLIVFAGNAYLQVPLTSDYAAAKTFLKTVNTELASTQGTAIGEAIRMADKAFESGEKKNQALLIISDGENHEEDAREAAKEVAEKGLQLYTLGIGSPDGSPIPITRGGRTELKRTNDGSIVLSKLNEDMLRQIALEAGGEYYPLAGGDEVVDQVMDALAGLEQKEFDEKVFSDYEDQFQWFLALGLFFFTLEFFLTERRSKWFTDWGIFKTQES
ncbi:MAG: VWA domain-containing protein [Bacteroidota bacterium]